MVRTGPERLRPDSAVCIAVQAAARAGAIGADIHTFTAAAGRALVPIGAHGQGFPQQ